jgi:tetratricopeptide (TPR) repeat protein
MPMKAFESRVPAFALAGLLAVGAVVAHSEDSDATHEIMSRIVTALQVSFPSSFDEASFQEPDRRAEILAALEELASNSEYLERHSARNDAGLAFLSHSLAADAREIHKRYAEGRFEQSRFLLHNVTDVCVACHSRLPDDDVRALGRTLINDQTVAKLPLDQRAQYEIATRQFDRALVSFETWFADPAVSPGDIDLTGEFEDYLEVSLRVRQDPQRAIDTFERLLERDDVPERVQLNMRTWIRSLAALEAGRPERSPIEQARAQLKSTGAAEVARDERSALVAAIAASGVLHRYVAAQTEASPELGEAYYLMGVIESDIGRSFWASQTEHFLETAIRIGPGEPYAEPAFELLEAFVVTGYTGSSGKHGPADVRERLAGLQTLIDRARDR